MILKAQIWAHYSDYKKEHTFSIVDFSLASSGYVKVQDVEVEFEPPPESVLVAGTVEAYRAQQQKLRADTQIAIQNLEQQIQNMLSIEHKPDLEAKATE